MELTVTTMMSLDGVTQAPGGPDEDTSGGFDLGGWSMPYFDAEGSAFVRDNFSRADAFLLGRNTYDIFAAYWPHAGADNPIAAALNGLPKHVVSSRPLDPAWDGAALLDGELTEAVTQLKRRPGRELQVHGSVKLAQALLAAGLVDRHHLLVIPVALRKGHRLFDGPVPPTKFRLESAATTPAGVQLLTYAPDGAPVLGSFEDAPEPEGPPIIR